MNQRVKTLVELARALTPEERLELLGEISLVIDADEASDATPEEIEAAWVEEVDGRISDNESGLSTLVDATEVLTQARLRIMRKS